MKSQKLPVTDSIEELAHFWDTHDVTDYLDQLEEVTEPVFEPNPRRALVIRLEPGEVEAVAETAKARGVEKEALIREWVVEKLKEIS
ncbi:MAG TPA: CopG family antitoxin [Thermoanaerobaculia bacterium]|nr:CopG family antitoxin [Thermoanaerobaculia bacterium]